MEKEKIITMLKHTCYEDVEPRPLAWLRRLDQGTRPRCTQPPRSLGRSAVCSYCRPKCNTNVFRYWPNKKTQLLLKETEKI